MAGAGGTTSAWRRGWPRVLPSLACGWVWTSLTRQRMCVRSCPSALGSAGAIRRTTTTWETPS
eukprot:6294253-Prorocentrum_lima.AAC.1